MSNNRQGDYMREIEGRSKARTLSQPMRVACGLEGCGWSTEGAIVVELENGKLVLPSEHPLELAREHRREVHGVVRRTGRRCPTRGLNTFRSSSLNEDDREEIYAEIARRKRLHGVEA